MGRRRNVGEARSAGAGRQCRHPQSALEYQYRREAVPRIRCRRCGQELLPVAEPRPKDKRWTPLT